jgi:hypothetical protein
MKGVANFAGMVGGKDSLRKGRKFKRFSPDCLDMKRGMYSVGVRHQGCART